VLPVIALALLAAFSVVGVEVFFDAVAGAAVLPDPPHAASATVSATAAPTETRRW
jgi:hypothetical protein